MRGKVSRMLIVSLKSRITPAYAGKRFAVLARNVIHWDHPRICGEKARAYAMIYNEWGSPPHMRGKGK